jgi:hypothetical protein
MSGPISHPEPSQFRRPEQWSACVSIDVRKIIRLRSQAAAMRVLAAEAPTLVGRETMHRLAEKLDNLANRKEASVFAPFATAVPAEGRYLH